MDSSEETSKSTNEEKSLSTSLTASESKLSENESESDKTSAEEQQEDSAEEQQQAYEGVTAADFQEFAEQVTPAIQGGAAALFVLVWVLFFLAGIMSVQTLLRSLEP